MSPHGCVHGVSQGVHPTPGESLIESWKPVPDQRRDTGTSPLGHASSPSLGRSVADFLSAHGPRGEIPISRLRFVDSCRNCPHGSFL